MREGSVPCRPYRVLLGYKNIQEKQVTKCIKWIWESELKIVTEVKTEGKNTHTHTQNEDGLVLLGS